MLLESLTLHDVRNYAALEFAPEPGLNVFVGSNAQGKSNLLEAIGMLGTGRSFRTTRDREVIREGCDGATISGRAQTRAGAVQLACTLVRGTNGVRKRYTVNAAPVRYAGYLGRTRVVTFAPHDLELIVGPPSRRRALLNAALSQERPAYFAALSRYATFLEQKSALLRAPGPVDVALLATYDERLVATGADLMAARAEYVASLAEQAQRAYAAWSGDALLEVAYAPNIDLGPDGRGDPAAAFATRLAEVRTIELARRTVVAGPHRDDVTFRLGGRALAAFGSQGQQRSAVLALKRAEYATFLARAGEAPLLLLDDVLSELDPERQSAFLAAIGDVEQAFITATTEAERFRGASTYRIAAASIRRAA